MGGEDRGGGEVFSYALEQRYIFQDIFQQQLGALRKIKKWGSAVAWVRDRARPPVTLHAGGGGAVPGVRDP